MPTQHQKYPKAREGYSLESVQRPCGLISYGPTTFNKFIIRINWRTIWFVNASDMETNHRRQLYTFRIYKTCNQSRAQANLGCPAFPAQRTILHYNGATQPVWFFQVPITHVERRLRYFREKKKKLQISRKLLVVFFGDRAVVMCSSKFTCGKSRRPYPARVGTLIYSPPQYPYPNVYARNPVRNL